MRTGDDNGAISIRQRRAVYLSKVEPRQEDGSIRPKHRCRCRFHVWAYCPLLHMPLRKRLHDPCVRRGRRYGYRRPYVTRILLQIVGGQDRVRGECNTSPRYPALYPRFLFTIRTDYSYALLDPAGWDVSVLLRSRSSLPVCISGGPDIFDCNTSRCLGLLQTFHGHIDARHSVNKHIFYFLLRPGCQLSWRN